MLNLNQNRVKSIHYAQINDYKSTSETPTTSSSSFASLNNSLMSISNTIKEQTFKNGINLKQSQRYFIRNCELNELESLILTNTGKKYSSVVTFSNGRFEPKRYLKGKIDKFCVLNLCMFNGFTTYKFQLSNIFTNNREY